MMIFLDLNFDSYSCPNQQGDMTLQPYTDDEWNDFPHVVLIGDTDWDPSILDNSIDDNDNWFDTLCDFTDKGSNPQGGLVVNRRAYAGQVTGSSPGRC